MPGIVFLVKQLIKTDEESGLFPVLLGQVGHGLNLLDYPGVVPIQKTQWVSMDPIQKVLKYPMKPFGFPDVLRNLLVYFVRQMVPNKFFFS